MKVQYVILCQFLFAVYVSTYAINCGGALSTVILALCHRNYPELRLIPTGSEESEEELARFKRGIVDECCRFACNQPNILEYCESYISRSY